jgi:hypothetical protein
MRVRPSLMAFTVAVALAGACAQTGGFPDGPDGGGAPPGSADAAGGGVGPSVLPFAVDDWFAPSGYMGDGEQPGRIADEEICASGRPPSWVGVCHRFSWNPGAAGWAGVYWQHPDGNWGDQPGLTIPPGATGVTFRAWGAGGGETVSFMVGMVAVDGFELKKELVTLGAMPAEYSIALAGQSYGKVVGGFGWVAEGATAPLRFHVDDIRWQ